MNAYYRWERWHALVLVAVLVFIVAAAVAKAGPPHIGTAVRYYRLPVPGERYHAVTQATLGSTVCVSGYTSTIRPPVSYTSALKRWLLKDRQLAGTVSDYELDHAIPLELGGAPYSTDNLFMEAQPQATRTDSVENALHRRLCAGVVSLREAQRQILEFKRVNG